MSLSVRDQVIDFIAYWRQKTGFSVQQFLLWSQLSKSKYYQWVKRYGQPNRHNAPLPKEGWLLPWEKEAIEAYWKEHPDEGYRRLCYMMLDENIVAVSPSSVYRVLKAASLLERSQLKPSKKGTGFKQPLQAHQHWHIDICFIKAYGTLYPLCSILDGYSRVIVHWEIRVSMKEADIEIIIQRAREFYPGVHPRIISDNGPQFIAKEFKEFIHLCNMTHVRTSPYYPQSNGKLERYHRSLKSEAVRPKQPDSQQQALQVVENYVERYNHKRLHSAIGYVAPMDKLMGKENAIFEDRQQKLKEAKQLRTCLYQLPN